MQARYKFREKELDELPLSLEFVATLPEWRGVLDQLSAAANGRHDLVDYAKLKPLHDCVSNLVRAIDDATGRGYKTRGYQYATDREDQQTQ